MITLEDFKSIYTARQLEKSAASWRGTATGAAGGAALGLLLQALRPKDKDQNKWKEYALSALTGAGLGAAAGFAYDNLGTNKFMPSDPSQPNSVEPTDETVELPDDVRLEEGRKLYKYVPGDSDEEKFYKDRIAAMQAAGDDSLQTLEEAYAGGIPLASDGSVAANRFFIINDDLVARIIQNNALFADSKGDALRKLGHSNAPVMIYKSPNGGGSKVIVGYMDPGSHILYPAVYKNRGVVYDDDENMLLTVLRSLGRIGGDVVDSVGSIRNF